MNAGSRSARQSRSGAAWSAVKGTALNAWNDLIHKPYLAAADAINGTAGELYKAHLDILGEQAKANWDDVGRLEEHYLASGAKGMGGDLGIEKMRFDKAMESIKYDGKVASAARGFSRFGSKLPFVGAAITAIGIGIDIHNGKPKGKALISGIGGGAAGFVVGGIAGSIASAAVTGAAVGSVIPGAGTVAGFVAGAVVGTAAGLLTSGALDYAYDHLSQNVQQGIENGVDKVGEALSDAGSSIASGAKDLWNSIF